MLSVWTSLKILLFGKELMESFDYIIAKESFLILYLMLTLHAMLKLQNAESKISGYTFVVTPCTTSNSKVWTT